MRPVIYICSQNILHQMLQDDDGMIYDQNYNYAYTNVQHWHGIVEWDNEQNAIGPCVFWQLGDDGEMEIVK